MTQLRSSFVVTCYVCICETISGRKSMSCRKGSAWWNTDKCQSRLEKGSKRPCLWWLQGICCAEHHECVVWNGMGIVNGQIAWGTIHSFSKSPHKNAMYLYAEVNQQICHRRRHRRRRFRFVYIYLSISHLIQTLNLHLDASCLGICRRLECLHRILQLEPVGNQLLQVDNAALV